MSPGTWWLRVLAANRGHCFKGPSPKAKGFVLSEAQVATLLSDSSADYAHVVRPFLTARDTVESPTQTPSRWTIDFHLMSLEQAMRFPAALAVARDRVKPERETKRRRGYREKWWIFAEPRTAMRQALDGRAKYVASSRHGKRPLLCWVGAHTLSSDAGDATAPHPDVGIRDLCVAGPGDGRPEGTSRSRLAPAARPPCRDLHVGADRADTEFNNADDRAWTDLKALHKDLDEAVADCYVWPKAVARDDKELVGRLTELNREIIEGGREYSPFG